MANANTLINSLQIVLMSIGAIFIVIVLSFSLYPLLSSVASELPTLWLSFKAWLRPPYLYFIINGIIIIIAASSRVHHHHAPPKVYRPDDVISEKVTHLSPYEAVSGAEVDGDDGSLSSGAVSVKDVEVEVVRLRTLVSVETEEREKRIVDEIKAQPEPVVENEVVYQAEIGGEGEDSTVNESSTWILPQPLDDLQEILSPERQTASSKLGHRPRPAKANLEGRKVLRKAKPKRHETLESIWKAIMEEKQIQSTRDVKKSDTWENQSRQINLLDDISTPPVPVKKSETFKDRTNYSPPAVPSSRLKKEPSLSQDELNQRAEAFINKFNEDMRLQRQESMQKFMEKINRAA